MDILNKSAIPVITEDTSLQAAFDLAVSLDSAEDTINASKGSVFDRIRYEMVHQYRRVAQECVQKGVELMSGDLSRISGNFLASMSAVETAGQSSRTWSSYKSTLSTACAEGFDFNLNCTTSYNAVKKYVTDIKKKQTAALEAAMEAAADSDASASKAASGTITPDSGTKEEEVTGGVHISNDLPPEVQAALEDLVASLAGVPTGKAVNILNTSSTSLKAAAARAARLLNVA